MSWVRYVITRQDVSEARADLKKASFFIDESVDFEVAELICRLGFKATHVTDVGLSGHPDENVLAYAKREDRILLTRDPDFLNNRTFPPHPNPGIVVLPRSNCSKTDLIAAVEDVVRIVGASRELWRSTKIVVTPDRTWTVHTFERDTGQVTTSRYRRRGGFVEIWEDEV